MKPMRTFTVLLALGALLLGLHARAGEAPLRVLILSGQNNHEWRQTTPKLKSVLESSQRFVVEVTDHPEQCDAKVFGRFDVLLSDWNTFGNPTVTNWPEATRTALLEFVRNGKGFVVVHAGGSSFYDWPEYQQLAITWWKMGQTSHGAPHEFTVEPSADHPITRDVKPFRTADELWVKPGFDNRARVLATGDGQPLAFVADFGRGRSFALLLGHSATFMNTPGFQTLLLRGTEWAATGKVTLPAETAGGAANVDGILKALAQYRFGDNRQPVLDLEKFVAASSHDAALRQALAAKLASVLSTDATLEARQTVCRQLSLIGSAAEVPALAKLLPDKDLGYCARLALERIPAPEAETALLAALAATSGEARLGVIDSLGARRSDKAVPELSKLLVDDAATAGATIRALGRIGGDPAAAALLAAEANLPSALKPELSMALLRCAETLVASSQFSQAAPVLEKLVASVQPPAVREVAFSLQVRALGANGQERLLDALSGSDVVLQAAAVRALRGAAPPAAVARAVAGRVEKLPPALQVQTITWLGEQGDPRVQPELLRFATNSVPAVRQATLTSLGAIGGAEVVSFLARLGADASAEDKRLVTESLARLRGPEVDQAITSVLKTAPPAGQPVLIRAVELRQATMAVPLLLELSRSGEVEVRRTAIAVVGSLGDVEAVEGLAPALETEPERAASAMTEICRRKNMLEPLLAVLAKAAPKSKCVLLEALPSLGGSQALKTVREDLRAENPDVRAAAVRALANWPDAAPLEDVAAVASTTTDARCRTLALRGVARLAPLAKDRPREAVELITRALKADGSASERKALVAALAEMPGEAASRAVEACLNDPSLASEAKAALAQLEERRDRTVSPWDEETLALFRSPNNLCRGAIATNLDNLTPDGQGQGPSAALDGDPASYWDETDNQPLYWLRVEFKQPAMVASLRILGYQHHNYAPKDFAVLADGKLLKQVANAVYRRNLLSVELPPTQCRSLELKITGYYGQSPAIRELGIYGKPDTAK